MGISKIALATSLVAALSFLSGCQQNRLNIAVIPRTTATLLWEPMHMGVAEEARDRGMHVHWNAPANEGDVEKQVKAFSSAIADGYSGIVFAPDETSASRSIVQQAMSRQIPVVIVDDELGPPAGRFLSYVSSDEATGANLAAQRIATVLHGRGSIAVIGISPRLESGLSREEYFERALARLAPQVQIRSRHFGDTMVTHQQQIAMELLNEPQPVDAIVALTATATRGAYYARLASGGHSPAPTTLIIGFDQDALLPIRSGAIDSVIAQNTRAIGQIALINIENQIHGRSVQAVTLVPPLLMTRDTIDTPELRRLREFTRFPWSEQ